jgi:mono/diheme cytochrome c family protein
MVFMQLRARLSFLVMCGIVAVVAVACGRASQDDINNALQITVTATLSDQQIADNTAVAVADQATRDAAQAALSSPGANGGPVDLASAGNPLMGRTAFLQRCQGCHKPAGGGIGPALAGPDNPAVALTDQQLVDLLRTGEGHASPPGPLSEVDVNEAQMVDIIAFIRQQSK